MTSPSRRNRPTTRPSSSTPRIRSRRLRAAAALAAAALAALAPAAALAGELQWRAAGAPAADSVRLAVHPSDRSVLINRAEPRVAQAPTGFDPFEADDQLTDEDAAMPATDPAAPPEYDPFDDPATEPVPSDSSADASTDESQPSTDEAFDAPTAEETLPQAADNLDAAAKAIDDELLRREVESGADAELALPEPPPADEPAAAEPEPSAADELVTPPDADESLNGPDLTEEDVELDMQFGSEGVAPPMTPEQLEERRRLIEQERVEHEKLCNELYDDVRNDNIKSISLDISLRGVAGEDYPFECLGRNVPFEPRSWPQTVYLWKASGLCHKPLYFEQVQLERYGHEWGPVLQPIMSGAHFFGTIPILPYKMGLETPQECIYSLGYYRPGSCAPYMITQPGFTWRAAAFQTGAVTGVAAAVP